MMLALRGQFSRCELNSPSKFRLANMRNTSCFKLGVRRVISCLAGAMALSACAHGAKSGQDAHIAAMGLKPIKIEGPQLLRLKGDLTRVEKVAYYHGAHSRSFEGAEMRHQKDESLVFTSQTETVKVDSTEDRITQIVQTIDKDGAASMYDFAMPEPGEKLEVVYDGQGRIYKASDFPDNSIFFVPPISLPEKPVEVGETWTMQSSWLSLGEMVPYQLDMVSILKGYVACGEHRCAEIEISGDVGLQGPIAQAMKFSSQWRGNLLFNIDVGSVIWSRVDSDEAFSAGNVSRSVDSCLEAVLQEPAKLKLPSLDKPKCEARAASPGTEIAK